MLEGERVDTLAVSILIPAHGSFNDMESANRYVNEVLNTYPAAVEAVAAGRPSEILTLTYKSPTGREAYRAVPSMRSAILIRPTFQVLVKIKHTGTGKGFVVTTAYPKNKDADY